MTARVPTPLELEPEVELKICGRIAMALLASPFRARSVGRRP